MTIPNNIPYNPRLKAVGIFSLVATVIFATGVLSLIPTWFAFPISAAILSVSLLLFLRRFIWRRQLTLAEHSITVPSGFLRLRATCIAYDQIERIWSTRLLVTSVICVRTPGRQVEIQDIYFPDFVTFLHLKQFLLSAVQSAKEVH